LKRLILVFKKYLSLQSSSFCSASGREAEQILALFLKIDRYYSKTKIKNYESNNRGTCSVSHWRNHWILVAPDKGEKTRRKIGDKFDDVKDSWKKFRGATLDELDELKSTFKHEIAGLQDDARERVLELIKAAKTAKNNVKEEASLS